jgi:hypothetical protein
MPDSEIIRRKYACPGPQFEAHKPQGQGSIVGGLRLITQWPAHPDMECRYVVASQGMLGLMVKVFRSDCDGDDTWPRSLVREQAGRPERRLPCTRLRRTRTGS